MSHPQTVVVVKDASENVVTRDRSAATSIVVDPDKLVHVATAGVRGPQGTPGTGGAGEFVLTAAVNIPARHVVAINADGLAYLPDRDVKADAANVAGVAKVAALVGEEFAVVTDGVVDGGSWALGPLFLGDGGALTSTPGGGAFQLQVAAAVTPTRILVRPQLPIFL